MSTNPSTKVDKDPAPAGQPVIDDNTWYRISNSIANHALDVVNTSDDSTGKIELRPTGNYSGQFWRVRDIGGGHYSFQTRYLGPEKMLDVYGNDPRTPHLANAGNFSGQKWSMRWVPDTDTFWLSNTYGGLYLQLDTRQGKEVVMAPQDEKSGTQRWRFTPIEQIEPAFPPGFKG